MRAALPVLLLLLASLTARSQDPAPPENIFSTLDTHAYGLQNEGRTFLLSEAQKNNYFLLGELHGDNEIPALLRALWPEMNRSGYRYIAAEISPWTADQLEAAANPSRKLARN